MQIHDWIVIVYLGLELPLEMNSFLCTFAYHGKLLINTKLKQDWILLYSRMAVRPRSFKFSVCSFVQRSFAPKYRDLGTLFHESYSTVIQMGPLPCRAEPQLIFMTTEVVSVIGTPVTTTSPVDKLTDGLSLRYYCVISCELSIDSALPGEDQEHSRGNTLNPFGNMYPPT